MTTSPPITTRPAPPPPDLRPWPTLYLGRRGLSPALLHGPRRRWVPPQPAQTSPWHILLLPPLAWPVDRRRDPPSGSGRLGFIGGVSTRNGLCGARPSHGRAGHKFCDPEQPCHTHWYETRHWIVFDTSRLALDGPAPTERVCHRCQAALRALLHAWTPDRPVRED